MIFCHLQKCLFLRHRSNVTLNLVKNRNWQIPGIFYSLLLLHFTKRHLLRTPGFLVRSHVLCLSLRRKLSLAHFFSLLWLLSLNTYFRHRLKDTGKAESDAKLALSGCSPSSVAGEEWSWGPSHGGTLLRLSASPLCVWGPTLPRTEFPFVWQGGWQGSGTLSGHRDSLVPIPTTCLPENNSAVQWGLF